jgi:hypothetical protein
VLVSVFLVLCSKMKRELRILIHKTKASALAGFSLHHQHAKVSTGPAQQIEGIREAYAASSEGDPMYNASDDSEPSASEDDFDALPEDHASGGSSAKRRSASSGRRHKPRAKR